VQGQTISEDHNEQTFRQFNILRKKGEKIKLHVFYRKEITKQEKALIVFVINFNSFKTNEGQKCHS
jgi:hypothetical protein